MSLEKHDSLVHAEKVLKIVQRMMKGMQVDCVIEVWSGGREQGFHISRSTPDPTCGVSFAEHRGSDGIVVLTGPEIEFDITTNVPSNEIWSGEKGTVTGYKTDTKAARAIADFLAYYPTRELSSRKSRLSV